MVEGENGEKGAEVPCVRCVFGVWVCINRIFEVASEVSNLL
jgi:hypothetical protein